jgi:hypothetical protein
VHATTDAATTANVRVRFARTHRIGRVSSHDASGGADGNMDSRVSIRGCGYTGVGRESRVDSHPSGGRLFVIANGGVIECTGAVIAREGGGVGGGSRHSARERGGAAMPVSVAFREGPY